MLGIAAGEVESPVVDESIISQCRREDLLVLVDMARESTPHPNRQGGLCIQRKKAVDCANWFKRL
jgi:hypothetical protein